MTNFNLHYLADKPEFIETCAAWDYGRWGVQKKNRSLTQTLEKYTLSAQKNGIPLTIVATDKKDELPVSMGSLWEEDGPFWPDVTPWAASIFTLYKHRRKGVAQQIITRLEEEAKQLGFKKIYLQSGSAATYYPKLGYQSLETIKNDLTMAGTLTLFYKPL